MFTLKIKKKFISKSISDESVHFEILIAKLIEILYNLAKTVNNIATFAFNF